MEVILSLIFIITVVYLLNKYFFSYWTREGIFQYKTTFLLGTFKDLFLGREYIGDAIQKVYEATKNERFCGIYMSYRPVLMINDPVLIKSVLIKDFQYFYDRGMNVNFEKDPMSANLFFLEGQQWKNLRTKLSPAFTMGKIKAMFPILTECSEKMKTFVEKEKSNALDIREIFARYTTDIIASVVFGIQLDSFNQPDNDFRNFGKQFFRTDIVQSIRVMNAFVLGKSGKKLGIKIIDAKLEKYFTDTVRDIVEYREKNGIERKDLLQALIDLRNEEEGNFSFRDLCAQAIVFYMAGFETSSSAMSFLIFELAKNPQMQSKLQSEIDESLCGNNFTFENIDKLKFLEKCLNEIMRMYPPVPMLNREATKNYKISDSNVTIEKGTPLIIPVYGIHNDPSIYENPREFNPDRFENTDINQMNSDGITYMPFGDGARICIGMRLGKIVAKLGVVTILSKFNFELADKNDTEIVLNPRSVSLLPIKPIKLKVTDRK